MKIQEVLDKTTIFFKTKEFSSPRLDAELLISKALGVRRIDLYLKFDQPLSSAELELCREFVRRRSTGEPVAYILNRKEFFGLDFYVDNRVLVPRPETELMVEWAIKQIRHREIESPRIADFGSGTGCIGLSVLSQLSMSSCRFFDASEGALKVAETNAASLKLTERAQFSHGRIQDVVAEEYDLILANPPYIEKGDKNLDPNVAQFEPAIALYAEDRGLREIFEWAIVAFRNLKVNGEAIFEIGYDQAQIVVDNFIAIGFADVRTIKDLSGIDRFVAGKRGGHNG